MKKITVICSAICGIMLVFSISCMRYDDCLDNTQTVKSTSIPPEIEFIAGLGIDTTGYVEMYDYFIVDGKVYDKDVLPELMKDFSDTKARYKPSIGFVGDQYRKINIAYGNIRFKAALDAYNAISGCGIEFMPNKDIHASDFIGFRYIENPYDVAAGYAPNIIDGKPTGDILINWESEIWNYYIDSAIKETYMYMHVLGHLLGFEHIDNGNYTHIPGTNEFDNLSIMLSDFLTIVNDYYQWRGFTDSDKQAFRLVYPSDPAWDEVSNEKPMRIIGGEGSKLLKLGESRRMVPDNLPNGEYSIWNWEIKGPTDNNWRKIDNNFGFFDYTINNEGRYDIRVAFKNKTTKTWYKSSATLYGSDKMPTITMSKADSIYTFKLSHSVFPVTDGVMSIVGVNRTCNIIENTGILIRTVLEPGIYVVEGSLQEINNCYAIKEFIILCDICGQADCYCIPPDAVPGDLYVKIIHKGISQFQPEDGYRFLFDVYLDVAYTQPVFIPNSLYIKFDIYEVIYETNSPTPKLRKSRYVSTANQTITQNALSRYYYVSDMTVSGTLLTTFEPRNASVLTIN